MKHIAFFLIALAASWSHGATVSENAAQTLSASHAVLARMNSGWDSAMMKEELTILIEGNMEFIDILSQSEFAAADVNAVPEFQRFSKKILDEQKALIYVANQLARFSDAEGLIYEDSLERRQSLSDEWDNQINSHYLNEHVVKSLVNRILFFGLDDKYKAMYGLAVR